MNKVARAPAHGFDGQFHISPGGHHDNGKVAVGSDNLGEQVKTFLPRGCVARVVQVDQNGVIGLGGERFPNLDRRFDAIYAVSVGMEQQLQRFENVLLIVGREDPRRMVLNWIRKRHWLEVLRLGRSRHARYGDEAVTFPLTAS